MTKDPTYTTEEEPLVLFLNQILNEAIKKKATDIHFEPYENFYRIRFRLDGLLHTINQPPLEINQQLSSRLKIIANLDIAEKRLPQDGRYFFNHRDIRVSTCPTLYGEKIVFRLLDNHENIRCIDQLDLTESQQKLFLSAIEKPQGLILVTGPTGSGKTVTLYAALNYLNVISKNICTVEDPVEIQLPGINQVNIHQKAGLDFAKTLRTFLRQDPDIIMVGEIRDLETAEIALHAAQTGHLVLSTLHTNSSIETITRLMNIGLPSYEIASSISLITAQRLIRKLCVHCKDFPTQGCEHCTDGYAGRMAIHEILPMTEEMAELVFQGSSIKTLKECAKKQGMISLKESGDCAVRNGLTTEIEIKKNVG
jgi:type IV pilus assembly protein PilB